jgi:hypothetical protein
MNFLMKKLENALNTTPRRSPTRRSHHILIFALNNSHSGTFPQEHKKGFSLAAFEHLGHIFT